MFDRQTPLFKQVLFVQASPGKHKHVYVFPLLRQIGLFDLHGFDEHGSNGVVVVGVDTVVKSKNHK